MDWLAQYSAALDERDSREQAQKAYINAYTKLADRNVSLAMGTSSSSTISGHQAQAQSAPGVPVLFKSPSTSAKDREQAPVTVDTLAQLRADLSTTQKARSSLQTQLAEQTTALQTMTLQSQSRTQQMMDLTRQKTDLERRLRDRDEELRGKTRLAESAQDEMVAQGLQLNLAEQKAEKLERENRELVARWMKRMGEEVERLNRDSQWE